MKLQINKGWFRIWIIASCIWVVGATYLAVKNYQSWYDDQTRVEGEYLNYNRELSREEEFRLFLYYFFGSIVIIAGIPLAVPAGALLVLRLEQWIRDGFESEPKP